MKDKKQIKIAIIILTLLISVGGLCLVLPKILNSNNKGKTYDDNNVGEIYYSPTEKEHIIEEENGVLYADNELVVVAEDGVTKDQIIELASEYKAEVVGCIEQTGDYQWKFDSEVNVKDLVDTISNNEMISDCSLNYFNVCDCNLESINHGEKWTIIATA